jgi:hypothetical protein
MKKSNITKKNTTNNIAIQEFQQVQSFISQHSLRALQTVNSENSSIGILLCQEADRSVVEYAMSRSLSPTMVAEYKRQLIPKEVLQRSLDEFCNFLG